MTLYSIRSFDKRIDTAFFSCGQPLLDQYIRRYASQDIKRNVARVFIAAPEHDINQLAGFYTLSAGSVSCSDLPELYPEHVTITPRLV